jgi:HSP20 family protein
MTSSSSTSKPANNNSKSNTDSNNNIEISNRSTDIQENTSLFFPNYYNYFFETFRQNMQNVSNMFEQSWPSSLFPSLRSASPFEIFDRLTETRLPVCDVVDRGNKYEINFEIPGIDKEKIEVKATKFAITVSAVQTEKVKDKGKRYIYSERSYKSFSRQIPFAEEILPSQIKAKLKGGILEIDVPKMNPSKGLEDHEVRIDVI